MILDVPMTKMSLNIHSNSENNKDITIFTYDGFLKRFHQSIAKSYQNM